MLYTIQLQTSDKDLYFTTKINNKIDVYNAVNFISSSCKENLHEIKVTNENTETITIYKVFPYKTVIKETIGCLLMEELLENELDELYCLSIVDSELILEFLRKNSRIKKLPPHILPKVFLDGDIERDVAIWHLRHWRGFY